MGTFILVLAVIGSRGPGLDHIEFGSLAACEAARQKIVPALKADGAPGWTGDTGILVKAVCVAKDSARD